MGKAADILISRIRARLRRLEPDDPKMREALTRIGIRIQASVGFKMRGVLKRRTGKLANSIKYQLRPEGNKATVVVGSFGVPYAAIHEFGGTISRRSRKGLLHNATYDKRAYLKPAFDDNIDEVLEDLRKVFNA